MTFPLVSIIKTALATIFLDPKDNYETDEQLVPLSTTHDMGYNHVDASNKKSSIIPAFTSDVHIFNL